MRNTYNWLSISFKIVLVVICGYGLYLHTGPGRWFSFNYYTLLSNAVCFIWFLVVLAHDIKRLPGSGRAEVWRPRWEAAVMFCITVTFLIYHFLLRPESFRMGGTAGFYSPANIICHYIVPIMVILDWLLFCPKGFLRRWEPATWLLIPLTYFAYIVVRAQFAGDIGNTGSPYPYGFIDANALDWGKVLANVGWSALGMALLAYLIWFADRGLSKIKCNS